MLDKVGAYLTKLAQTALPKSNLRKAVNYARNQWEALRRYTEDGRLTIDNNVSERTLTQKGRKKSPYIFGMFGMFTPSPTSLPPTLTTQPPLAITIPFEITCNLCNQ